MRVAWLAQIGVSPGGAAILVVTIYLLTLLLGALLLGVMLIRVMRRLQGRQDAPRLPKKSERVGEPVVKPYDSLTTRQRKAIFDLRETVFQNEQGIVDVPDRDGIDPACDHVIVTAGQRVVGTARLQTLSATGPMKVGRLAVSKAHRGQGLGTLMMARINTEIKVRGLDGVMHAQAHLEDWYAGLGWRRVGAVFTEAGIEHVKMRYTPGNGF